jgi:hypothetical protein
MNSRPRKNSQYSGKLTGEPALGQVDHEGADDRPDQRAAPAHGATQMAISMELAGDISEGLMMPTCGT